MHFFGRTPDTLWTLLAAPAIWASHFLASYMAAAYVCAPNADIFQLIGGVRVAIGIMTAVALALIALFFYRAWRDWRRRTTGGDRGTRKDQEGFLEFATMLLATLSFLGVLLDATPALFIADCR